MIKKTIHNPFDVIIIGAGPAGLAAATILVQNNLKILLLEKDNQVGGISKTIKYKGFRFDLGGHRFFTKSEEVNRLWLKTLPKDFLIRPRLSRIYYRNKFFHYPVKPMNVLQGLGIKNSLAIILSYIHSKLTPYGQETTFEQWVSNRFGKKLFNTFFKTYTEKLWGLPCNQIHSDWASQRIKGLSLFSTLSNALFPVTKKNDIKTLINQFRYPKYGPGMMYEKMAENISSAGGVILTQKRIIKIKSNGKKILSVIALNNKGQQEEYYADNFISSMPISDLINQITPAPSDNIILTNNKLLYRSFITVNIILSSPDPFPDTWIYIHSPEVQIGRIQNYKKWSPFMAQNNKMTPLGLEYFCTENDSFWKMTDANLIKLALREFEKLRLGRKDDFLDGFVIRVPKAYPVYDLQYVFNRRKIINYLKRFRNLQTIGRYGMFRYNNMDHSIVTGLLAAKNILLGNLKYDLEKVNSEAQYHEEYEN